MLVNKSPKPLWFGLAVCAAIALAELVAAPIHSAGRAQAPLGYVLGAAHLLNTPGFTAATVARVRVRDDWSWLAFGVEMTVDLAFWAGVGLIYLRSVRRFSDRVTPPRFVGDEELRGAPAASGLLSRRALIVGSGRAVAAAGASTATWGFLVESHWFEVTRRQVGIKGLSPGLNGLRIVQLTDIHHSAWTSLGWVRQIVDATNALAPDVVALTGDYVYRGLEYVRPVAIELAKLRPRVGVVGVMGNHDWWQNGELTRWAWAKEGLPLIDNARRFVTPDRRLLAWAKGGLCLAGVGDLWEDECLYDEALGGVPGGMPRVLLSHNPDVAEEPAFLESGHRVDLMLSGHTHGGQVRLPVLGSPVTNSAYGQKYAQGLVDGPACPVYVSRGLGMTAMPVRLGVRPEIAVIELRCA